MLAREVTSPVTSFARNSCWQAVLGDIANATLAFVMTWSLSSVGAHANYTFAAKADNGIWELYRRYASAQDVRLIVDAKGAPCHMMPAVFGHWLSTGRLHCFQGPNRASREAHTILNFVLKFYDHLPRVTVFLQDDPDVVALAQVGVGSTSWLQSLENAHNLRAHEAFRNNTEAAPHVLRPCPCWVHHEGRAPDVSITERDYGHFRSVSWWLRTFMGPTAERRASLPTRLSWPGHSQFAVTRAAVRSRSRSFWAANEALASLTSPSKYIMASQWDELPTSQRGTSPYTQSDGDWCTLWRRDRLGVQYCAQWLRQRHAKWANFGPVVVDLGDVPPKKQGPWADKRRGMHGMDVANMFERLWFVIFDPLWPERATLPYAKCFTAEALSESPVRCGEACARYVEGGKSWGGCALSDRLRQSKPPPQWRYAAKKSRCQAAGCMLLSPVRFAEFNRSCSWPAESCNDPCHLDACFSSHFTEQWLTRSCN